MTHEPAVTQQFFVVGSGRCGSTLLSKMLHEHRDILSLSEVMFVLGRAPELAGLRCDGREFARMLVRPLPDQHAFLAEAPRVEEILYVPGWASQQTPCSTLLLCTLPLLSSQPESLLEAILEAASARGQSSALEHCDWLFEWLRRRFQRRIWVERSGASIAEVDTLAAAWPCAKFVFLTRDGAECARSMARHPVFRVWMARELSGNPALPIGDCLQRDIPAWRYAAAWSTAMRMAARSPAMLDPERTLLLSYEALLAQPEHALQRLATFLGVEAESWSKQAAALLEHRPRAQPLGEDSARLQRACVSGQRALEHLIAQRGRSS